MGEESTWFDLLPGLNNLTEFLKQYLGRENPSQKFYFQAGPFAESHFNLTHVMSSLLVLAFVTMGALSFASAMRRGGEEAIVPPARFSLRNLFELLGDSLWNLMQSVMGEKNARTYLPLIGTLACFIFFSNALALIPGMVPPTTTLKTNVALAVTVFVITHVEGIRSQGLGNYLKHFADRAHQPHRAAGLAVAAAHGQHGVRPQGGQHLLRPDSAAHPGAVPDPGDARRGHSDAGLLPAVDGLHQHGRHQPRPRRPRPRSCSRACPRARRARAQPLNPTTTEFAN
jgi:hypothetical protein